MTIAETCAKCGHVTDHVERETSLEAEAEGVPYLHWISCSACRARGPCAHIQVSREREAMS